MVFANTDMMKTDIDISVSAKRYNGLSIVFIIGIGKNRFNVNRFIPTILVVKFNGTDHPDWKPC